MMMLRRAESEMAPMTATGIASNSGQGVAITSTARNRCDSPLTIHAATASATASGRVPGAEHVPQTPHARPSLLRFLHDLHDLRVSRINRQLCGPNGQCGLSIDGAGKHFRSRDFGHFERFAGQVGFVHFSLAFDNYAVHRADFMRKYDENITDCNLSDLNIRRAASCPAVRDVGHPSGKRFQDGRGASHREFFQSRAARKHQHYDRPDQVLAHQYGHDNRQTCQQVGTKFTNQDFLNQSKDEWHAA